MAAIRETVGSWQDMSLAQEPEKDTDWGDKVKVWFSGILLSEQKAISDGATAQKPPV